ncbi:hypothetical protein ECC02_005392 [Trypanosoma cruzi]|uniref:Uncharacterized protein n=1 Tax=Trypanosoma cruzi TaxID=5693 RepID=A0A7J6Y4U9_TRYCR|nr:hypothetical protein ECC02_005392 [Trypanosoma cruzi]
MASVGAAVVVPILVICVLLLLLILAVIFYYFYHTRFRNVNTKYYMYPGFARRRKFELSCVPAPGLYQPPLEVRLQCSRQEPCDILLDVKYVPASKISTMGDMTADAVRLLGTDDCYSDHFMLYTEPLEFIEAGRYMLYAYTVYPTLRVVGSVHQFCFDIVSANRDTKSGEMQQPPHVSINVNRDSRRHVSMSAVGNRARPIPPRIIPEKGEVTTFTPINIALSESSTTPDQIRYSVDGSPPSLLYTGPFTLSLPPFNTDGGGSRIPVVIRALTVSTQDGLLTSETTEAHLTVYKAGHSFFDPNIPPPVARVRALEAELYFDESRRPPNTSIIYQIVYVGEARQKPKFSHRKGILYEGKPVPLKEDVAFVYAWTFREDTHGGQCIEPHMDERGHGKARSSAAVYDCNLAMTWNREARREDAGGRGNALPPPCICIRCKEMDVFFEDPPVGGIICYTLDGTEPAQPDSTITAKHLAGIGRNDTVLLPRDHEKILELGTHVYRENQPIHVTLMRTEQVVLTARTFIPVVDLAANSAVTGYRFGECFNRSFSTL